MRNLEQSQLTAHRFETIGRFAFAVSHDVDNVLNALRLCAESAQRAAAGGDDPGPDLAEVKKCVDRVAHLNRQLLDFGRRAASANQRVFDAMDAIRDAASLARRLLGGKHALELEISEEPVSVRGNPAQLEQVILNLLINARDAMPNPGTVTLRAGRENSHGELRIEVVDAGAGISEEDRDRIFEPLFTTKRDNGSGMGLAIVKSIVEEHEGRISVESEPGHGSRFAVTLPIHAGV